MYRYLLYHADLKRPQQLKVDPLGWESERKSYERDPNLHGVFLKYNPELKFVDDGRELISTLYNTYGIEAEIILTIQRKDVKTREWKNEYTGRLNLTTLEISKLFATCKVDELSFYQKIKNLNEVKLSLQSTTDQNGNVMTPGADLNLTLHSKTLLRQFSGLSEKFVAPDTMLSWPNGQYFQFTYDPDKIDEISDRFDLPQAANPNLPVPFLEAKEAGDYTFNLKLLGLNSNVTSSADGTKVPWYLQINANAPQQFTLAGSYNSGATSIIKVHYYTLTYTVTLAVGDQVFLYGMNNYGADTLFRILDTDSAYAYTLFPTPTMPAGNECKATITALTKIPSSNCVSVLIYEAWQRLVRNITGKDNSFKSRYYGRVENGYAADGNGSLRAITNGDQIRGFDVATRPIYASVKELLDTCKAIDGVGMGLETNNGVNQIVVEPLAYFYQNKKSLRLSYVQDIKRSVASNYYYNEVEVGYNNWNNRGQQLNNLDEVNSKRTYTLPITQIKKKLSLISPYIAAGYSIEFVRRAVEKTTDTERDKDNYIIQLRRNAGTFEPEKNQGMTIANVIDPGTVYNARLSPMQNLIRNAANILGSLYQVYTNKNILMSVGEANNEATVQIGGGDVVNEKSITISKLGKPLWYPEFYEFEAAPSADDWASFEASPYGYVEFSASNKDYIKGFLMSATPDAETRKVKFKLLAAAL